MARPEHGYQYSIDNYIVTSDILQAEYNCLESTTTLTETSGDRGEWIRQILRATTESSDENVVEYQHPTDVFFSLHCCCDVNEPMRQRAHYRHQK